MDTISENKIELKTITELLGMHFFIPSYQRGYRWTEQQVEDLLNDIWEFSKKKKNEYEFYCIQPLVIKEIDEFSKKERQLDVNDLWYEVIDGQQRLTTIYLILSAMKDAISILGLPAELYEIQYQRTIKGYNFTQFLKNVRNITKVEYGHIEYYHISSAYLTIKNWLEIKKVNIGDFCNAFLKYELDNSNPPRDKANNIRFIWYESVHEDPVRVFRRLNNGKIKLTDAELVKALLLNRSNFGEETEEHLKLRQQEIASEWDSIEYALQNDEFWLFLCNIDESDKYKHSTRIDFIFDLMCDQKSLGCFDNIGTDEHRTFRYFYEYFHSGKKEGIEKINHCWIKVKKYFQTFQEWYNDLLLYHYVGYLIYYGEKLNSLYTLWDKESSKENFVSELKKRIKDKIKKCNDLAKQYEIDGPSKTTCKPLLLLHNIQTIINQNNKLKSKEEYKLAVFYKFPYHIFKKEHWDVEHIDSNTTNDLGKTKDQKEWLKYTILGADLKDNIKEKIKSFIQNKNSEVSFDELADEIEKLTTSTWANPEQDKNKVWNFVLLDAGTNRGYGNSIFPAKRRCIIGKDQGKSYTIDDDLNVTMNDGAIAFIPPVTRNVFLKYYNSSIDNLREWNEKDAIAYKQNILDTLKDFGVTDSSISVLYKELLSNNQNTESNEQ